MTVGTKEIVTTVAYMIGVKKEFLVQYYDDTCHDLLESLSADQDATTIRYLNKLKTSLMKHFKKTDYEMRYNMLNLDKLPQWYDEDNIRQLEKWGIQIIQANYRSEKYMEDFTRLLNENIDKCQHLFYDWIKFEYIKEFFYIPKYLKKNLLKSEFEKYMTNINSYPFQMYIYWKPENKGNMLYDDSKFLSTVYSIHGDYMGDRSKVHDAGEETKANIYDFIDNGYKVVIAVDCENSDVFKLYGVLKNLNQEELGRIEKIMLYDDAHTSTAWEWLSKFTKIPVEYMEVERVTELKSLVDIKMTAGVCSEYYRNGVDSFIICSSDSDFWGLISSLPDANFLVLYEYSKCGKPIKEALKQHEIFHCAMDDFYTGNAGELKKVVLLDKLESYLPQIIGMNGMELARKIYEETRITCTAADVENFYNKYIKSLRLKIDADGNFYIDVYRL